MSELYYHLLHGIRSRITAYVCTAAAVGLVASVPVQKNEFGKTMSISGALALSLAATANFRSNNENENALADFRINTGIQRQRNLFASASPTETTENKPELEWFDFSVIGNDRDKFPNVIVIGEPGSGKTTLAEYLGVVLKANKRYAIHPHAKPTDFAGFDKVFGGGRNYGTPDDELLTWESIIGGNVRPTIAQVLMSLLELMNRRYEKYYQGETNFDDIDVYIDELPSIVSNLGKKFIASIMPQLLMECRKVGIRLWLLTQGSQVKMLGLEGMSDLREGITFVRLGRLALKHAGKNKELVAQLSSCSRPCLVDDTPAKLVGFAEMHSAIKVFARANANSREPSHDLVVEIVDETTAPSWQTVVDQSLDKGDFARVREQVKTSNFNRDLMHHVGHRMVTEFAKAMSSVVKDGWGMEGDKFQQGRALYYELQLDQLPKGNTRTTLV